MARSIASGTATLPSIENRTRDHSGKQRRFGSAPQCRGPHCRVHSGRVNHSSSGFISITSCISATQWILHSEQVNVRCTSVQAIWRCVSVPVKNLDIVPPQVIGRCRSPHCGCLSEEVKAAESQRRHRGFGRRCTRSLTQTAPQLPLRPAVTRWGAHKEPLCDAHSHDRPSCRNRVRRNDALQRGFKGFCLKNSESPKAPSWRPTEAGLEGP